MLNLTKATMLYTAIAVASTGAAASNNSSNNDTGNGTRVVVSIENLAPSNGTFQTPFWIGFHDGVAFDTYNGNTPANSRPVAGSNAMESLCEDGSTAAITADFSSLIPQGQDTTLPGPNGPIAPGDIATTSFVLDGSNPAHQYFSYASMVLPSNDFCISNGNPKAHEIFDDSGNFVGNSFFVSGSEVLDAGTEVNDELPANTAFFGQAAPNTGVNENGVIGTLGSDITSITGFNPIGSGGILDTPRFAMADFSQPGYPMVKISFTSAPAVTDDLLFQTKINSAQTVPAAKSRARGFGYYQLSDEGTRLVFSNWFGRLRNVTAAHLHLGAAGETGPVVVDLLAIGERNRNPNRLRFLEGEVSAANLLGPLQGQPLDVLSQAIKDGNVYINVHTEQNPSGDIRGQLNFGHY